MKKIVNLTPHAITFVDESNIGSGIYEPILTVNPSGQVARVTARTVTTGVVDVCALDETAVIFTTSTSYGEVEGLPDPSDDTIYIVSSLVASRVPDRADVFIPNESVRDDKGRIIGCKSLGHI